MLLIDKLNHIPSGFTIVLMTIVLILGFYRYFFSDQFHETVFDAFRVKNTLVHEASKKGIQYTFIIIIYSNSIAVLLSLYPYEDMVFNAYGFIINMLVITAFILLKRYVSLLVAMVIQSYDLISAIENTRMAYRLLLTVIIISFLFLWMYSGIDLYLDIRQLCAVIAGFLLFSNIIVIWLYRKLLLGFWFYFIVYLCTLEIAPYVLLYKYFRYNF